MQFTSDGAALLQGGDVEVTSGGTINLLFAKGNGTVKANEAVSL